MAAYTLLLQSLHLALRTRRHLSDLSALFRLRPYHQAALAVVSPCQGFSACQDPYTCPYHTSFGQQLPTDPELVRRHQKPPHPFAWHVPLLEQVDEGEEITVRLVLVGRAAEQVSSHVAAISRLFTAAMMPDLELVALSLEGVGGELIPWSLQTPVHEPEVPTLQWDDLLQQAGTTPQLRQRMQFLTPLRLMSSGRPVSCFDSSLFLRQLLRRCSALADCYGNDPVEVDFRALADASRQIVVSGDQLQMVRKGMSVQGLLGEVELVGDLQDFWPWLQLGQLMHVGKGAAYGLGNFQLI